ncbi:MAG: hypothetical protein JRD89_04795 [Deltaproteobacteria bacterium]|nr:hypothetical protein [Deltaproteobacteria bacterium]
MAGEEYKRIVTIIYRENELILETPEDIRYLIPFKDMTHFGIDESACASLEGISISKFYYPRPPEVVFAFKEPVTCKKSISFAWCEKREKAG